MSSALAIAAVTFLLKDVLRNGMTGHDWAFGVGDVGLTTLPLDRIETTRPSGRTQLNLFMYHVTPNQGWRNVALPSRGAREGERLTNQPLALDLHYLLTAYGMEEFHSEMLLGYAMQMFHEKPVFTRQEIHRILSSSTGGAGRALTMTELAEQVEQIKISPQVMSSEELSKLWTAFQSHYRPTVVYQVTTVLIESRRPTRAALPVRERRIHVMPFRRPSIREVSPQAIAPDGQLTIMGENLQGEIVKVKFGEIVRDPMRTTDEEIQVALPPTGLRAGVNTVQVVHSHDFGTDAPAGPRSVFESNVAAFILSPRITTSLPETPPLLTVARGSTLRLSVLPPVEPEQKVWLIAGDKTIPANAREGATSELDFLIPLDFPVGASLIRVRVEGAESPLVVDTDAASPTFGQYVGPRIEISG